MNTSTEFKMQQRRQSKGNFCNVKGREAVERNEDCQVMLWKFRGEKCTKTQLGEYLNGSIVDSAWDQRIFLQVIKTYMETEISFNSQLSNPYF